ncbi:MAG TPA: P-loop NTPase [Acetobacteraceae bacterium]|jgi:pilus assembly protein CpaE
MSGTEAPTIAAEALHTAPIRDSAQARTSLLAFVADDETETALRGGLLNSVEGADIRRGTILHAIRHLASEPTPRALVVDIAEVANPLTELDNLAGVCSPDVSVLVVGDVNEIGLYRQLVRNMGVDEYVHKPLTRDRVARLFVPHIIGTTLESNASHGGSVIAVCGARGGAGTTTVAVNLALQLADSTRGHVALLDMHLKQGTTALMLGVKPMNGLRIALEQPERADALFLDRVSVEINPRLRLIAADEALDGTPSPTQEGVRGVLELLRKRFNYIVMDLPTPATPAEMQPLRGARHLVVVMTPDIVSIRDADRLRQLAASLGAGHTTLVLNRAGMPGGLKPPLIEQGLDAKPTIQIPELAKQLGRAANLGRPALGECAPFKKAIALLAQELSGAPANRGRRGSLFGWMSRR